MLGALNTLFLTNSNNDINDLWNKIITILMPNLMGIDVMVAVFMIAFVVIKGKGDKNSENELLLLWMKHTYSLTKTTVLH